MHGREDLDFVHHLNFRVSPRAPTNTLPIHADSKRSPTLCRVSHSQGGHTAVNSTDLKMENLQSYQALGPYLW